jgi:hypothetical protein
MALKLGSESSNSSEEVSLNRSEDDGDEASRPRAFEGGSNGISLRWVHGLAAEQSQMAFEWMPNGH